MAKTELEKYRSFVSQQLKRLSSILQQYTRGDFSKTIPIPEEENEFTEFLKVLNQLGKNLGDCMQEKEQNQDKTNQL